MYSLPTLKYYWFQLVGYINYYLSLLYNVYRDYPYEIKVAICILVSVFVLMGVASVILIYKAHRTAKDRRVSRQLGTRFSPLLNTVMYSDICDNLSHAEMLELISNCNRSGHKTLLANKQEKLLFCRIIYDRFIVDTPTSRTQLNNLHTLLEVFDIPAFLENQVSLGSMSNKVMAMTMLRTFKLYINPWVLNKLLNSRNIRVRRLAMYSSIMSSSDSDLDYFETDFFDDNSCIYDEIELGYTLHRRKAAGLQLPNLAHWAHLQKKHDTRCMFVRLMRRFDQSEFCFQLEDLFRESRHKKLIEEISRTWGYLNYADGEDLLVHSLLAQPDDTKVAILHAITRMATGKSLHVLEDGFLNTANPHVRFEALRCIYNYGDEGRALFERLESQAPEKDRKFFDFFHNSITLYRIPLDKEQAYHPSVETVHSF